MYGFIYETTNLINGKKYIGKCVYNCKHQNHKTYLGSGLLLKRAIKKYGRENFTRKILEEVTTKEELERLEEYYLHKFRCAQSPLYYNITNYSTGGDIFTYHPNKEKIRQKFRRQKVGRNNPMFDQRPTKQARKKIARAKNKPIQVNGITYFSIAIAAQLHGITPRVCRWRLDSPNFPTWVRLEPKLKLAKSKNGNTPISIEIDGIYYNTITDAQQALGRSRGYITRRLDSAKFPNYKRLE